jgi:hypothetical protein
VEICPLATTCSECGLVFELRLVLNERLREQVEFIEVARRRTFRRYRLTLRRSLNPWKFWRWVAMEHKPNVKAMLWIVPSMILLVQLLCAVVAGLLDFIPILTTPVAGGFSVLGFDLFELIIFIVFPWFNEDSGASLSFVTLDTLFLALVPVTFLLLPDTLRIARVRRVHILRIAGWSLVGPSLLLNLVSMVSLVGAAIYAVADALQIAPLLEGTAQAAFEGWSRWGFLVLNILLVGWGFVWWGLALSRYLKLPVPWLITLCLSIIAFLAAFLICLLLPWTWYDVTIHLWR